MNARQKKKRAAMQAEQQAALNGIKEIVQSTIEAVQGMGHIQIDLQRFVNQQKVTLGAYRDLLKDIYRWQDWRQERPKDSGLYLVYTVRGIYGMIRLDKAVPNAMFDQCGAMLKAEEITRYRNEIRYWRPFAEIPNWMKNAVDKEAVGNPWEVQRAETIKYYKPE